MTFCSLISFSDSPDTARRLRGLILPQGPLRWVAFERGSTRAVVAMEDDYVSSAMAVIERMAILQQSVTVADAVEMVEHKVRVHFRSFPFEIERRPGGSRDVTGLFFVHCPPESRDGLEREFGSASVSFDLSESTDLAMIQLFELDEAAILADLELRNWSGAALAGDKAAAGIHGRPSVSMTSALKKPRSCLAAVER